MRHANAVAVVVLVLSVAGFAAYLLVQQSLAPSSPVHHYDLVLAACQVLPYGVVGAVLVARRPDLPFGWLLSFGAMALVLVLPVVGTSYWLLEDGGGNELALWGLSLAPLGVLPLLLQGPVNVLFPSGRAEGRFARVMYRMLAVGIPVAIIGGVLTDTTLGAKEARSVVGDRHRFIDGTVVNDIGNLLALATPLVILLGVIAGIRIVVRCFRVDGVERKQLQWRAAGVVASLLLFPFAVTESLPGVIDDIDPFIFVVTLLVPVLRYDLWAIDTLIRRSAAYTLTSSGSAVANLVRTTGEMLRLSYVAVLRDDVELASYGQASELPLETWPLHDEHGPVGLLVAAPRHGRATIDERDRSVLATVATLVTESVRADALTSDLQKARQVLVTAREEERRRLRRDLHDGLGPLLTGLGLNLDAARDNLHRDGDKATTYLGQAKEASAQVIQDLRELVQGLRPPALDELGLAGALQLHAGRIAEDAGIEVHLALPENLQLPAAVEVAVFRTAVEALNNVVKHSDARSVGIELQPRSASVRLVVSDDGSRTGQWVSGVGMTSMRERAEELGGLFTAGPAGTGGGRVEVQYPVERIEP
ncbi:MAG: sensor histidine kinase [Marmoricola sp.]